MGGRLSTENSEEPFAAKKLKRRTNTRPYALLGRIFPSRWNREISRIGNCEQEITESTENGTKIPLCSLRPPVQMSSAFLREPSSICGQFRIQFEAGRLVLLCGKNLLEIARSLTVARRGSASGSSQVLPGFHRGPPTNNRGTLPYRLPRCAVFATSRKAATLVQKCK
jgi:hypothetical protein